MKRALLLTFLLACACDAGPTATSEALEQRVGLYECGFGSDRLLLLDTDGTGLWDGEPLTWTSDEDDEFELRYDNEDPRCDVALADYAGGVVLRFRCRDGEFSTCVLAGHREERDTPRAARGTYLCSFDGPEPGVHTEETWSLLEDGALTRSALITNDFGEGTINEAGVWVDSGEEVLLVVGNAGVEAEFDDDELRLNDRVCPAS